VLNQALAKCLVQDTLRCRFIRCGSKVIKLEKGKAAIIVGKPDNLIPTIDAVIAAVNAGELDGHLAQMGLARPLRKAAK
jgi:hypothetical protein